MENCIFCKIAKHEAESAKVFEDEDSIAFLDHYPLNPGHTLVVPKKHYPTMAEMPEDEVGRLFVKVARLMKAVRSASRADGINIGQSNGTAASQEVPHMHVHVIPRFNRDSAGGLTFPERKRMSQEERERIAGRIRKALAVETGRDAPTR